MSEMPAGRELDALVAEKVMGFRQAPTFLGWCVVGALALITIVLFAIAILQNERVKREKNDLLYKPKR